MKIKDMFDKLLHNMSDLLKNGSPRWSSMRAAFLLAVLISNFAIFGVWVSLSVRGGAVLPIPESVIFLYAISNGLSIGGKLIQKPLEKKKDSEVTEDGNV